MSNRPPCGNRWTKKCAKSVSALSRGIEKRLVLLARPPRLERGTLCLEGRCSIQLSYGRLARRLAAAACSRKFAQRASYETARYWQCHAAPAHARDLRLSLETPGWPNKPQAANALQAAGLEL